LFLTHFSLIICLWCFPCQLNHAWDAIESFDSHLVHHIVTTLMSRYLVIEKNWSSFLTVENDQKNEMPTSRLYSWQLKALSVLIATCLMVTNLFQSPLDTNGHWLWLNHFWSPFDILALMIFIGCQMATKIFHHHQIWANCPSLAPKSGFWWQSKVTKFGLGPIVGLGLCGFTMRPTFFSIHVLSFLRCEDSICFMQLVP
jgi:hypothetical protein